ncbi:MAG: hypothetical protein LBK73_10045 [Treponema sp.]|jgi:hypothetical protein|nr:hypothetical protein [Treponema sp.]
MYGRFWEHEAGQNQQEIIEGWFDQLIRAIKHARQRVFGTLATTLVRAAKKKAIPDNPLAERLMNGRKSWSFISRKNSSPFL